MKTLTRTILTFLTVSAIIFLCFAFIKADMNPVNWSQSLRFLFVYLALILGSVVSMLVYVQSSDN